MFILVQFSWRQKGRTNRPICS